MKVRNLLLSAGILLFSLVSCAHPAASGYADSRYFAMDTVVTLRLAKDGVPDDALKSAEAGFEKRLTELDTLYSVHNEESPLYHFNHSADPLENADGRLVDLLHTASAVSLWSGGAFDDTLGALSDLWNIPGGGPVPVKDQIREALGHTGQSCFTLTEDGAVRNDPDAMLDLGAIAKGAAAEELVGLLRDTGVPYGLVSVGGNIGCFGGEAREEPFKIGIRDPDDEAGVIGYLYLRDGFVSVSGDYERYFEEDGVRYHHILDGRTGYPADSGLRSVAVWSTDGAAADALSTAFFVLGCDRSAERCSDCPYTCGAVFILSNHHVRVTPELAGSFELTASGYTLDPCE